MKFLIKGIVTRQDAGLAAEHGADGVIVSNHGARAEDSERASKAWSWWAKGSRAESPSSSMGGFRRGTDIVKALALRASAIMIGRPYVWGLASFGLTGSLSRPERVSPSALVVWP